MHWDQWIQLFFTLVPARTHTRSVIKQFSSELALFRRAQPPVMSAAPASPQVHFYTDHVFVCFSITIEREREWNYNASRCYLLLLTAV